MSCGAAFVQPFYLLALQRWGEFLELASFLWIFFVGVFFLWGGFFVGSRKWWWMCGGYILYIGGVKFSILGNKISILQKKFLV